jgi:hypothetical protein
MSGSVAAIPGYVATPSTTPTTLPTNYINTFDFSNQFLPDYYEEEFKRYGNQMISGLLALNSAEHPFSSDLIKWSEDGRLHLHYSVVTAVYGGGNDTAVCTIADPGVTACSYRVGQTVFLSSTTNNTSDKAIITAVAGLTFTVAYYEAAGGTINAADTISSFVYGSEFRKGSEGMEGSIEETPNIFEVSPVIIKDHYEISGSDMAQIGWIKVEGEGMQTGYYWYFKSKAKNFNRFMDYTEMMMIEHVEAEAGSGVAALSGQIGNKGTQGLFSSIEERGNVWSGGNPTSLPDIDDMIQRLDQQGHIEENAIYCNREFATDIDDMLAAQSSGSFGGISWGLFDNKEDMALNLGFKGFNRSGYNFYKSSWRYLIDPTLRGGVFGGKVNGVLIPGGSTQVKDMNAGKVETLPYLHVRYRQGPEVNRKMESWILGSALPGHRTSSKDSMEVHYRSERALCTLGAVNFFLFKN